MEREAFLDNVAARLGRPRLTTPPVRAADSVPPSYAQHPFGADDLPRSQWPNRFISEIEALGGEAVLVSSPADITTALRGAIDRFRDSGEIVTWDRSEVSGWGIDWLWDDEIAFAFSAPTGSNATDIPALRERVRDAGIGITTTDFAIANTGTLLIFTSPNHARSVSLLPRHHIALVRESQMVARMGDTLPAFAAWPNGHPPSSLHFITGPSRSADIENDLTIGVHGPATVTVIIWRDIIGA